VSLTVGLLKRRRSPWFWSDYLDRTRLECDRNTNARPRRGHSPALTSRPRLASFKETGHFTLCRRTELGRRMSNVDFRKRLREIEESTITVVAPDMIEISNGSRMFLDLECSQVRPLIYGSTHPIKGICGEWATSYGGLISCRDERFAMNLSLNSGDVTRSSRR
jgi:hypothetical protein